MIFGIWAKQYRPSGKKFGRCVKIACHVSTGTSWWKKNFLKKNILPSFFTLSEKVSIYCRKSFGRTVQNTFYMCIGMFWEYFLKESVFYRFRTFKESSSMFCWFFWPDIPKYMLHVIGIIWGKSFKNIGFIHFGNWTKRYLPSGKTFRQVAQNWIRRVQWNFMMKKNLFEKIVFSNFFEIEQKSIDLFYKSIVRTVQNTFYVSIRTFWEIFLK